MPQGNAGPNHQRERSRSAIQFIEEPHLGNASPVNDLNLALPTTRNSGRIPPALPALAFSSNREGSPHHAFIKSGRLSSLGLPIDSRQPFNDELDGTIHVGIAVGDRTRKQLTILWQVQT